MFKKQGVRVKKEFLTYILYSQVYPSTKLVVWVLLKGNLKLIPLNTPRVLIVTSAVYPRLVANYDFGYFDKKKWTHSTENLEIKIITFPWFSEFPNQNLMQIGQGVHKL